MVGRTDVVTRPQPVGAYPLPAGYLLIPSSEDPEVEAARASLCAGRKPRHWPASLRGHELAHAGRVEEAVAAFGGATPLEQYNRFVLAPDGVDLEALRAALPSDVAPLVDVVAYSIGLTDTAPSADDADAEIAALALATQASEALSQGEPARAVVLLQRAAELARDHVLPLCAVLLGNAAGIAHDHGIDLIQATADLTTAVDLLTDTDMVVGRAELHFQLASLIHDVAVTDGFPLKEAVHHYYCALQLVDATSAPHLWAAAHLNLGTAYLTMPMVEATDQLRAGIAMQSLRASLEVFTKDEHPSEWSSAQLNLANALVYTPSTHQGDNLVEAVERYEEVLELRDRHTDPLGRARLLANQGNALAHLGVWDHAKAKLYEARFLFEEHGDDDAVLTVRGVLDEIARESVPEKAPS